MTTIAGNARDGILVCDSRLNCDDVWMPCTKVFRIDGALIGGAGEVTHDLAFMEWYRAGRRGKPNLPKSSTYCALVLNEHGLFMIDSTGGLSPVERGFHGIGTGGAAATAAMMAGATALRAVEIACEIDLYSGPPIVVHRLKEAE